jgi:two-component system, OmpR family, KDP operon response regulator KdpE
MVTVRNSVRDKIDALDAGADDYIVKPFAMGELLARIRAALRRSSAEEPLPRIETSELTVDLEMRMIDVRGNSVHLTPKEFDVLRLLITQQGRPVTHRKILQILGTGVRGRNRTRSRSDQAAAPENRERPCASPLRPDRTLGRL